MSESHLRSVAKAISWRVTGTIDTFVLSFLITGSLKLAGGIAATEVVTKVVLFYGHERLWDRIKWGRPAASPEAKARPPVTAGPDRRHTPVCSPAT